MTTPDPCVPEQPTAAPGTRHRAVAWMLVVWAASVLVLAGMAGACGTDPEADGEAAASNPTTTDTTTNPRLPVAPQLRPTTEVPTTTTTALPSAVAPTTAAPTTAAPTTDPPPTVNPELEKARAEARGYLAYAAFSRQGLIDRLSSEDGGGYSEDIATQAVDSLREDWAAQAARAAQEYLEDSQLSPQELIDQLSSQVEGQFTPGQPPPG